jgi:hypothetical protein
MTEVELVSRHGKKFKMTVAQTVNEKIIVMNGLAYKNIE